MLREETIKILRCHNIEAEASNDEQQLIDPEVIMLLIKSAEIKPSETVLEVGSGIGNITTALSKLPVRIIAIEKNPKFLAILKERLAHDPNIMYLFGDILNTPTPVFQRVVSNLPYSLAEAFLWWLARRNFKAASLIVPKAFSYTLTISEDAPKYSRLSLSAQTLFHVSRVSEVPSTAYIPEPRVNTSIISLKPREAEDPVDSILRETLLKNDKKLVNALREAIITSSYKHNTPQTKRGAMNFVKELSLPNSLLLKRVGATSLDELRIIRRVLCKHLFS